MNTKPLKRVSNTLFYFDEEGKRVEGIHEGIRGDVSGIVGDFDLIPMSEREGKPNVEDWIEAI